MTNIADAARIVRSGPTSPTLALRHENQCPALSGDTCTCTAVWELRSPRKAGTK